MVKVPYQQAVGSLMYAMLCTWPDLAYPISVVNQHMANQSIEHWIVVKRIFQYLQEKYNSFMENNTWTLVPLPAGRKPVFYKWVFKIKQGVNGEVEHYKARLVAKGFTQTYGVDYNETFAFIVKFTSIRCILALAALEDMEIHQMDLKTTFFNGELEEEI